MPVRRTKRSLVRKTVDIGLMTGIGEWLGRMSQEIVHSMNGVGRLADSLMGRIIRRRHLMVWIGISKSNYVSYSWVSSSCAIIEQCSSEVRSIASSKIERNGRYFGRVAAAEKQ